MDLDNCNQFIVNVLAHKGACDVNALLETCKLQLACPKKLKTTTVEDFKSFLEKQSDFFFFRSGKVCSVEFENNYFNKLNASIREKGYFSLESALAQLNDCDKSTVKYIQAGNTKGVDDFLSRNSHAFEVTDGKFSSKTKRVFAEKDGKAISYFSEILLSKNGEMPLNALSGHWNQAPPEVKKIVKSTNPSVFREFLTKNSYFFEITAGDIVKKRVSATDSLSIVVEGDDSVCKTVEKLVRKISSKGGSLTLPQLVSFINQDKSAETIGTIGSRKLGDIKEFLSEHSNIFKLEDNNVSLHLLQPAKLLQTVTVVGANEASIVHTLNLSNSELFLEGPDSELNKLSASFQESKEIFVNLCGNEFFTSLINLLSSIHLKDWSKVEMIWFDIGRKPFVKTLISNPPMKFAIYELNDQPLVTEEFLVKFIKKLQSASPTAFGIKDYLHTFRVNLLHEMPVGITMFHQIHCSNPSSFKEEKHDNLRVIFYDRVKTYTNEFYSYVRNLCADLSLHHHVIIVDFNGKIAGYDPEFHAVINKSRCISCTSSENRRIAILEAFSHNPDYIVTNCLDIMDVQLFDLLKNIAKQALACFDYTVSNEGRPSFEFGRPASGDSINCSLLENIRISFFNQADFEIPYFEETRKISMKAIF